MVEESISLREMRDPTNLQTSQALVASSWSRSWLVSLVLMIVVIVIVVMMIVVIVIMRMKFKTVAL